MAAGAAARLSRYRDPIERQFPCPAPAGSGADEWRLGIPAVAAVLGSATRQVADKLRLLRRPDRLA
jgi:hypothetical protein